MIIIWEEMEAAAEETARAKEERNSERLQKQFDKVKRQSEAWQAEFNKLADMMYEGKRKLAEDLEEEDRRHDEAVRNIKTRNRYLFGELSGSDGNTTYDESLQRFLRDKLK